MRPLGWQAPDVSEEHAVALAAELGLRRLTARILIARGLSQPALAARFLAPRLADLRAPLGMADLDRALARLEVALAGKQRIAVFGDYDVDGVTTAAILTITLRAFGAEVIPRVASRHAGYGLGALDVNRFADEGCAVLVTGDCGTSDQDALLQARARGLDVIVIDHHQVPTGEQLSYALINPHRPDDAFPFKGLASCGVAFYLAAALRSRLRAGAGTGTFDPRDLLDLVALGSVADMVPLTDENRILVSAGLKVMMARKRPAIAALCALANINEGPLSAEDISFRMTPRLNAAGRLGEAQLSLDLLLAPTPEEAQRLAAELDEKNRERQRVQELVWTEALEACRDYETDAAIVLGAEGWHPGVVGIIAAKLVDRFARPAVVIAFQNGAGRGSARTVGGFNLYEALVSCQQHLTKFGGHAGAAGMSLTWENLNDFRRGFVAEAARRLTAPLAKLPVDAVVELHELDVAMAEELGRLAPFGAANAQPLFALSGVTAQSTRLVGQGHLQLTLAHRGAFGDAIAFGMADRDPGSGSSVDVVATAELDTFRGNRRTRLKVKHLYRAG